MPPKRSRSASSAKASKKPKKDSPAKKKSSPAKKKSSPAKGKGKKASPSKLPKYTFNINDALDKKFEGKSFHEIVKLPVDALQGLGEHATDALKAVHVKTVGDLGKWKPYKAAAALVHIAGAENKKEGRPEGSQMNFNKLVDKKWETKSLAEVLKAPPSALEGFSSKADAALKAKPLSISTIKDLGTWKHACWAEAIVTLSEYESKDHSS